jgi:hypothetical protein
MIFPCINRLQAFPAQEHRFYRFSGVRGRDEHEPSEVKERAGVVERNRECADPIALPCLEQSAFT